MADSHLDKILDHFPLFDGSGRRRFVSGGIILIGFGLLNWGALQQIITAIKFSDYLSSPIIAAGLVLIVYAIGSVADLFGDLFLIRAASGIFWSPGYTIDTSRKYFGEPWATIAGGLLFIPVAIYGILLGLVGITRYKIPLQKNLSKEAATFVDNLPAKVIDGLSHPVGDSATFAFKFIIDQFKSESDRGWARRQLNKARDVSAITTALFSVLFWALVTGVFSAPQLPSKFVAELLTSIQDTRKTDLIEKQIFDLIEADIKGGLVIEKSLQQQLELKLSNWRNSQPPTKDSLLEAELLIADLSHMSTQRNQEVEPLQAELIRLLREFRETYPDLFVALEMPTTERIVMIMDPLPDNVRNFLRGMEIPTSLRSESFNQRKLVQFKRAAEAYHERASRQFPGVESFLARLFSLRNSAASLYEQLDLRSLESIGTQTWIDERQIKIISDRIYKFKTASPLPIEQTSQIVDLSKKYNDEVSDRNREASAKKAILGFLGLPFLLLYFGFFLSIRHALYTILEAVARPSTNQSVALS